MLGITLLEGLEVLGWLEISPVLLYVALDIDVQIIAVDVVDMIVVGWVFW